MKSMHDSKKVFVEKAKTPEQLSRGLMFRKKLEDDSGMLFQFGSSQTLSFWGMNTFIPLDIAFIDELGVIKDVNRIKEHDLNSVKSSCPCKYALEISDGWFKSNGFGVGDYISFLPKGNDDHIMVFKNKNVKVAQVVDDKADTEPVTDAPTKEVKPPEVETLKEKEELNTKANPQETVKKKVLPPPFSAPKFNSVFDAINWSAANLQVMRIMYRTQKGHTVTKDIEPHSAFFSRTSGHQVLKAYDETAGHASQYIIMNIISYGFPGRKFVPKSILIKRRYQ